MTKTLSMLSHNDYNLNANEDVVTFFTSKLITCFIDGFTPKTKSQSIVYLLDGSQHRYWIWTLKVKCTQHEICGEVAFKNTRAMVFSKSEGAGKIFWSGPQNFDSL